MEPNTILGRPVTFGDVKQIEWLRDQALENANKSLIKRDVECDACYGTGHIECMDCDGEGTFKELECPHCHKHREYGIAVYGKEGDIVCCYCNNLIN